MAQDVELAGFERLFQALCDQTRLRLLSHMVDGPVSVGYLAEKLNESQPKISRHLAYLRNAGLVCTTREGKWVYYGVETQLDPAVQGILDATLQSVSGRMPIQRSPGFSSEKHLNSMDPDKASWDAAVTEWRPNEIDIHLL